MLLAPAKLTRNPEYRLRKVCNSKALAPSRRNPDNLEALGSGA